MKVTYKKYLIISVIGALLIGLSFYLFLNTRVDRVDIVVASSDLEAGKIIESQDLALSGYYKDNLPDHHLEDPSELVGKKLAISRRKGDHLTLGMLEDDTYRDIKQRLKKGEVLISICPDPQDYIVRDIKEGDHISLVSTQIDEAMKGDADNIDDDAMVYGHQLILRDLRVLRIEKLDGPDKSILVNETEDTYVIYLGCDFEKITFLADMTKDGNYKIFFENKS